MSRSNNRRPVQIPRVHEEFLHATSYPEASELHHDTESVIEPGNAFSGEDLGIAYAQRLDTEQISQYRSVAMGRHLDPQSLFRLLWNIKQCALPLKEVQNPGIVYVDGTTIGRQTNWGKIDRPARSSRPQRLRPHELMGEQAKQLRESGTFQDTTKVHVSSERFELALRIQKGDTGVVVLNLMKPHSVNYSGDDQVLDEMLAATAVLDHERHQVIKAQAAKLARKNRPFTHSLPLAFVRLSKVTEQAAEAGISPEGFMRRTVQQNQSALTSVTFSPVGTVDLLVERT